jgi:hypothetical protein
LYFSQKIFQVIKSKKMTWARLLAGVGRGEMPTDIGEKTWERVTWKT